MPAEYDKYEDEIKRQAILSSDELRLYSAQADDLEEIHFNESGWTTLHIAAESGDLFALKQHLSGGNDVDPRDRLQRTPLHLAAGKGNLRAVKYLLSRGANIEAADEWGRTPLHKAAEAGRTVVVKLLIRKGANVTASDFSGNSALHLASCSKNSKVVNVLLSSDSDTLQKNVLGRTPLASCILCGQYPTFTILIKHPHYEDFEDIFGNKLMHLAILGRSEKILKFLIRTSNSTAVKNKSLRTPLHLASELGLFKQIKLLISYGASVNVLDSEGNTPLHLAATSESLQSVSYLLDHGSDENRANNKGVRPHELIRGSKTLNSLIIPEPQQLSLPPNDTAQSKINRFESLVNKSKFSVNESFIEAILSQGYPINKKDEYCQTLLQYSVENCLLKTLETLLKNGANINVTYVCDYTLLHVGVLLVSEKTKNMSHCNPPLPMINKGCSEDLSVCRIDDFCVEKRYLPTPNDESSYCRPDLPKLNLRCTVELLEILIKYGADVNATNCHGSTPLHLASEYNNLEASKLLVTYNSALEIKDMSGRTPLFLSVEYSNAALVSFFLENGASVKIDNAKYYPIHVAAKNGRTDIIDLLLKWGARVEETWNSCYYRRPLHVACCYNKANAVKFLITKGANINSEDLWKRTCLSLSADVGSLGVVNTLLNFSGVDIDRPMRAERTPLMIAAMKGNENVSLALLKKANFRIKSADRRTVLHYASEGGDVRIVEEILKLYPEAINEPDITGRTPLFWAGTVGVFELLVKKGANYCLKTRTNQTVIHVLSEVGRHAGVWAALRLDIDVNAQDKDGNTALLIAARSAKEEVFLVLLNSSDPSIVTKCKETLLHCAALGGNEVIFNATMSITKNINSKDCNGRTPLALAAREGRYEIFQILLDAGADPTIVASDGDSVFHYAAHHGKDILMEKILAKTDHVEFPNKDGKSLLFVAAERAKIRVFYLLAKKGANFDFTTKDGQTILHAATIGGNIEIVEYTLNNGLNVNLHDRKGNTALFIAVNTPSKKLFECLLKSGADPNIRNIDDKTVLHVAALAGDIEIVKVLLNVSNAITLRDNTGKSPLFYAAEGGKKEIYFVLFEMDLDIRSANNHWTLLHAAAKGGNVDILNLTMHVISDINVKDDDGKTPLFVSVEYGQKNTFRFLVAQKANPDIPNAYSYTILHRASHYGNNYYVKEILNLSNRSLNVQDIIGETPLHKAVYESHIEVVQELLQSNADPYIENIYGYTPLMISAARGKERLMRKFAKFNYSGEAMLGIALAFGNRDLMNYFLRSKIVSTSNRELHYAAAKGDNRKLWELFQSNANAKRENFRELMTEIAKEFMDFTAIMDDDGVRITNPLRFRLSPLHMAILFSGSVKTVEIILKFTHSKPAELVRTRGRWTPLDMAAFCGRDDLVRYFIKNGMRANVTGDDSWTAVHKAAWGGRTSTVKLLFENGADINSADVLGRTPLHIAAMRGFYATVDQILKLSNASINQSDRYKFTPLHLAEIHGHSKYYKTLALGTITMDARLRYELKDPGLLRSKLRNHTRLIELLLEKGADPNLQDRAFGWTALHWSAAIGHLEVAKVLLNHKARVNPSSNSRQTPMYLARFWGRKDVYSFLREHNGVW